MQKSFINYKGVDYIVRTMDVRSIPTFGSEDYKSVQVAEAALWDALEWESNTDMAVNIDNSIFFYADTELMRRDPSDHELIDYLQKQLP